MKEKIISIVKTLLLMSFTTALLMFVMTMLFYKAHISEKGIWAGVIVTYFLTNFVGGFVYGKVNDKRKFMYGIIIGMIYFSVLCAVSIIFSGTKNLFSSKTVICAVSCIIGGMMGGMISS